MSTGKLITRHAFGVSRAKNCLLFKDDHHLLYASGNNVIVYNTETKEQNFIHASSYPFVGLGVTCISTNKYKNMIAIAEKTSQGYGVVSFFDTHAPYRKKKYLHYTDVGSKEIICTSFSNDGKFFAVQGGAPEWNLSIWNIEKVPKLLCVYKSCPHEDQQTVSSMSFCPYDHSIIAIFGKSVGKLLKYVEGN